jgi:hypothetical protein
MYRRTVDSVTRLLMPLCHRGGAGATSRGEWHAGGKGRGRGGGSQATHAYPLVVLVVLQDLAVVVGGLVVLAVHDVRLGPVAQHVHVIRD